MRRKLATLAIALLAFGCGGPDGPLDEAWAVAEDPIRDGASADGTDKPGDEDPPPEGERGGPPPGEEDHGDEPKGPQVGEPGGPPFEGALKGEPKLPGLAEGEQPSDGLLGKVVDGDGKDLAGAVIETVGTDAKDDSDEQGLFLLPPPGDGPSVLRVRRDGFQTMLAVGARPEGAHREVRIEMSTTADASTAFTAELGAAPDPKRGSVFVVFDAGPTVLVGVRAALSAPGSSAWVYDSADGLVRGDVVAAGATETAVVFPNVPVGSHVLTVAAPSGWACEGPTDVPVEAGTTSVVSWRCGPTG